MRPGRIRTIKPEYFHDEEIAELSYAAAFLFPGLWTIADREGRLRDRPREIKAVIAPLRDIDMEAILVELTLRGVVIRYEVALERYIQVVNFGRHQAVNHREPESDIPPPPPSILEENQRLRYMHRHACADPGVPGHTQERPGPPGTGTGTGTGTLPLASLARSNGRSDHANEGFDTFWRAYPKKRKKRDALKAWVALRVTPPLLERMLRTIDRDRGSHDWLKEGGQFIPLPATWLRAGCWDDEPVAVPTLGEPELRGARAVEEFLRRPRGPKEIT